MQSTYHTEYPVCNVAQKKVVLSEQSWRKNISEKPYSPVITSGTNVRKDTLTEEKLPRDNKASHQSLVLPATSVKLVLQTADQTPPWLNISAVLQDSTDALTRASSSVSEFPNTTQERNAGSSCSSEQWDGSSVSSSQDLLDGSLDSAYHSDESAEIQ